MLARTSYLTPGTLATLGLLGAFVACKKPDEAALAKKPPPPAVKVALTKAAEAPTPDVLVLTGLLAADQRSDITADTQGKVLAVLVDRGQRVKMGDPLVRLDVQNAALGVREAQANLGAARAQRQLAEEECKRSKTLLDKGAITQSEWDRQNTSCTAALQQVSAVEARVAMITKSVSDGIVRAPFEGLIAEKMVTAGEWVNPGKPLFTLVDDDPLKIQLSVPEAAVGAIVQGQRVELFTVAYPDVPYGATVKRIGAEIGRTRSLIVEAELDKVGASAKAAPAKAAVPATPAGKPVDGKPAAAPIAAPVAPATPVAPVTPATPVAALVPGMFAEAHLTVGSKPRPVLPASAVVKRGAAFHVFVAVKGELIERVVQIGPSPGAGLVSISQGVVAGDEVVTTVTDQITDGLRVE